MQTRPAPTCNLSLNQALGSHLSLRAGFSTTKRGEELKIHPIVPKRLKDVVKLELLNDQPAEEAK